jgi:folate-binding protein YgfZ
MTKGYYIVLPNRAAVTVSGADARAFLQGLVTQDIALLAPGRLAYSALLTPVGKYDFDFFMSPDGESVVLETDATRADDLVKRLSAFKLRKAITIASASVQTVAAWGAELLSTQRDPRHDALGFRTDKIPDGFEAVNFDVYDRLRLALGIPDGARDYARGEDTVSDMGLEKLNGVSFTKGCYMGQELTSRMHHRGLSKKGLYTVTLNGEVLPPFTDIVVDGNLIGEMRSSNADLGLAMLRHDSYKTAARVGITPAARI